MLFSVLELAQHVDGKALGQADRQIEALRAIDEASPTGISPYLRKRSLAESQVLPGAVIALPQLAQIALDKGVPAAIVHDQPTEALAGLIDLFFPVPSEAGSIHQKAFVDSTAHVHATATIGPLAVVESGVKIGEHSWIGPHAVISSGCHIGKHVRIGPGAVIGADGFGFVPSPKGPIKLRHVGRVVVEDFVEIGANTCVDRATLGTTILKRASKLDNLVQVGHNVHIGEQVLIAAQTGLAGSTVVEDDVMLGGQVGVADHVRIGKRAKVAAKSGVTRDVKEDDVIAGYPALPRTTWLRAMAWLIRMSTKTKW